MNVRREAILSALSPGVYIVQATLRDVTLELPVETIIMDIPVMLPGPLVPGWNEIGTLIIG